VEVQGETASRREEPEPPDQDQEVIRGVLRGSSRLSGEAQTNV